MARITVDADNTVHIDFGNGDEIHIHGTRIGEGLLTSTLRGDEEAIGWDDEYTNGLIDAFEAALLACYSSGMSFTDPAFQRAIFNAYNQIANKAS